MDGVLRQINLDKENKRESIPNILLTLYTSASDVYPVRTKANQKDAIHIDQPHLTLFGTATPRYFYESLSQRMLTNGFFARMMIIDVGKRGEGQPPGSPRELPDSILQTARWWADFQPGRVRKNLIELHPEPKVVPCTPEAESAITELTRLADAEYDQAHECNDEVACVAWSRTCENAKKLALLYACSANHLEPVIDVSAVAWATRFAMHQTRRQLYLAVLCIRADLIHNFYAIRRATYEAAPSDYRCKVDEHLDHFLRLKAHGARVFYTSEVCVDHHSREYRANSTDPLEAKFARVRNTGGQYHPYVRENWGLDPDKAWGIKITKVPFLDRRPKTPAAALTDAGRPNIIVLTPGRTGSGLLVKQLIALGWQANGTTEEYGEIPALYELNQRMLDSRSWPAAARDRFLSHLKTPWVLKDPRMIDVWDFWLKPIQRKFGKPLVIWSVRDPQWMRESFNAAGWTGAPWERRLERARAIYEVYDGPKLLIEHERLTEAMRLFDPR